MSEIPEPARNLLSAVLEALNIPYPATVGGAERYERLVVERGKHVVTALQSVLEDPRRDVEATTAYLRKMLAEVPPSGYVTSDQAHAALAEGKSWAEAVRLPEGEER